MFRKVLELLGLWYPMKKPEQYLAPSPCETLDSLLVLKILDPKTNNRRRKFWIG